MKRLELEGKVDQRDGMFLWHGEHSDEWFSIVWVADSHELRDKLKSGYIDGTKPIKVTLVVEQDTRLCGKTGHGARGVSREELERGNGDHPPCWQCVLDEGHAVPCKDWRGFLFDPNT